MGDTMQITCTDRIDREHPEEFAYDACKKFEELNTQCGLTNKFLSFPVDEITAAIKKSFVERESPQFLFGHVVFDFNRNNVETFVGALGCSTSYLKDVHNVVKIFSGKFLS